MSKDGNKNKTKSAKFLAKPDRKRLVSRLLLAGISPAGIADQLRVHRKTVEKDVKEIREAWEAPIDLDEATQWAIRTKRAYAELLLELGQDSSCSPKYRQGFLASGVKMQREYEDLLKLQERLDEERRRTPSVLEQMQGIFEDEDQSRRLKAELRKRGLSDAEIDEIASPPSDRI